MVICHKIMVLMLGLLVDYTMDMWGSHGAQCDTLNLGSKCSMAQNSHMSPGQQQTRNALLKHGLQQDEGLLIKRQR